MIIVFKVPRTELEPTEVSLSVMFAETVMDEIFFVIEAIYRPIEPIKDNIAPIFVGMQD